VFPPSFRELPPPKLDLFDLDEHFTSEKARLAQLTNKCKLLLPLLRFCFIINFIYLWYLPSPALSDREGIVSLGVRLSRCHTMCLCAYPPSRDCTCVALVLAVKVLRCIQCSLVVECWGWDKIIVDVYVAGGEDDVEYYVRECGDILGISSKLPVNKRSAKDVLQYVFQHVVECKKLNQVSLYDTIRWENFDEPLNTNE